MGIYFNPNNESFTKDLNGLFYVDKTGLIKELNKMISSPKNCIAVSHARRFGKSQAAGMIDAYYSLGSDSKELFSKYEIAKAPDFEKHLNKYNVIHLDVASAMDLYKGKPTDRLTSMIEKEIFEVYSELEGQTETLGQLLVKVFEKSNCPFVIIIDEWDCIVRNYSDQPELVHEYLQFLHILFKSEESKKFLALGYITGILPIKKIKDESALNNFFEYTMLDSKRLTTYFGFTDKEVQDLCAQYNMDYEQVKEWYNGYKIGTVAMYNPNSVYMAMYDGRVDSYWKNTSAFSTINEFIMLNYDGLKDDIISMLSGEAVPVDVSTFKNDLSEIGNKDEALTALIHLGYLGYDSDMEEAFIPNYEVKLAYQAALKTGEWTEVASSISKCNELLKATIRKDTETVEAIIEEAHQAYTSILKYNNENALACVLTMAYFTAPAYYEVIREMPAGVGFADLVFVPRKNAGSRPAMIIELKWNDSPESAIEQIKSRNYAGALKNYKDEILLVGISYDKDSRDKKHHAVIEVL